MSPESSYDPEHRPGLADEQLQLVGDSLQVVLSLITSDFRFQSVNRTYEAWLGMRKERIESRLVKEIVGTECFDRLRPYMERALRGEKASFERWLPYPSGGRFVQGFYAPARAQGNGERAIIELLQDITERKDNERQLQRYQDQLSEELAGMRALHELGLRFVQQHDLPSLLQEILQAAITVTNSDMGHIQLVGAERTLRIQAQIGFAEPYLTFYSEVKAGSLACGSTLAKAERVVVEDIERSPIFRGTPALKVNLAAGVRAVQSTPLIDRTGSIIGILSTHYRRPTLPTERDLRLIDLLARQAADLIGKIRSDEALRQREAELEMILDGTPFRLTRCSRDLRYQFVSHAYAEMLGRTPAEIAGKPIIEIMGEAGFQTIQPFVERVLRGEQVEYDREIHFAGVGLRSLRVIYTPETDAHGEVTGWIASILDHTGRKWSERDSK